MATEDQILLKLVIKGMDPSEVSALAQSTQGELNAKIKTYLDQLVVLHKAANEATTKDAKAAAQDQIDIIEKQVDAVGKVGRAHEIAANRASSEWRRTAEDLENITTVARGVIDVMSEGWEKFKKYGEEIAKDAEVYKGLHGSIEQMREATHGTVSDIDLISAKNRGYQKELQLTDEQYGTLAAAAKQYASVTGTDVKEALDKLVDGMATGRLKMLAHVGVMIDAKKAAEEFAEAHQLIADKLTDEEKLLSVQEAAMRKMTEKTKEFGEEATTVADVIKMAFAKARNAITGTAAAIGNIKLSATEYSPAELERLKAMPVPLGGRNAAYEDAVRTNAAAAAARNAQRNAAIDKTYDENFGDENGLNTGSQQEQMNALAGRYAGTTEAERSKLKPKKEPDTYDLSGAFDNYSPYGKQVGGEERLAKEAALKAGMTGENPDFVDEKAMDQATGAFVKHKEEMQRLVDDVNTKTGGGFFTALLFGPNGPDQAYKHMDEFTRSQVDSMGMVSAAGKKMTDALGANLAASIAGDKQHAASARQITHDVLESMAAQAIGRALMETAEGVASLAMYNFPAAALHFESAALFGAIGVGAGLGARAVGQDAAASSGNGTASSSGGGGFTSGPRSGSGGGTGQNAAPITINISNVLPGSEAQVGREVAKALSAYTRESGSSITDLTTGKAAA